VWEAIAWAIIGQQINVAFAARCKAAFCAAYGEQLNTPQGTFTLFPTPEAVAPLGEEALQTLQFSRQKARYVIGVARAIVEGGLEPEALHGTPADQALDRLMALKGVGRWTAEYVLLRGLGHPDALPAGDVALQRAVGVAYGLGRLATEAEVRAYGERWAPYRSYAAIAFWRSNATAAAARKAATAP
jgi:DNA-3-methyladenine glycosylase II